MRVAPLDPAHHDAAATVLADAFVDDPGWVGVGPRNRTARHRYIRRTCLGAIRAGARWCGPSWCVLGDDAASPLAVLTGAAPGRWPTPRLATAALLAPGPLRAGPATLVRSLKAERVIEAHHPAHEHFLVWMFAVSPAHQRRGLGRLLMTEALASAEAAGVPAYLWTGNPDNLPYYRSHGFEPFAQADILPGVPNWFLERPAAQG